MKNKYCKDYKHVVKVYGVVRTGTNYIQTLINENCVDTFCYDNQLGGKHQKPPREHKILKSIDRIKNKKWTPAVKKFWKNKFLKMKGNHRWNIIIIIKNPYSWYHSWKRFKGGQSMTKWYGIYNQTYTWYKDLYANTEDYGSHYGKVYKLKYEDLLRDPEKKMEEICAFFKFPMKSKFTNPNKINMSHRFSKQRRAFYLRADTFDLSPNLHEEINSLIDWELMKFYGYEKIEV